MSMQNIMSTMRLKTSRELMLQLGSMKAISSGISNNVYTKSTVETCFSFVQQSEFKSSIMLFVSCTRLYLRLRGIGRYIARGCEWNANFPQTTSCPYAFFCSKLVIYTRQSNYRIPDGFEGSIRTKCKLRSGTLEYFTRYFPIQH